MPDLWELNTITGASKSTVSKFLNGGLVKGNTAEAITQSAEFLIGQNRESLQADPVLTELESRPESETTAFITKGQKVCRAVLSFTEQDKEFSLITGPSGIGKSEIAKMYAKENDGVLMVEMKEAMTYGDILTMLLEVMGQSPSGSNYKKFCKLTDAAPAYRMLIVDEADLFCKGTVNSFLKKISIFRQIYESGLGVCLIGLNILEERLRESGETYIYSRFGYQRKLGGISPDELAAFWKQLGGKESDNLVEILRMSASRAWLRTLEKIYLRSKRVGVMSATALIFGGGR
ncbi:MAG: ATP-binding protein [Deltaproteobacteria bacterium]|nr:ATP-binding protein [Deltaproteobacteria bacterium]